MSVIGRLWFETVECVLQCGDSFRTDKLMVIAFTCSGNMFGLIGISLRSVSLIYTDQCNVCLEECSLLWSIYGNVGKNKCWSFFFFFSSFFFSLERQWSDVCIIMIQNTQEIKRTLFNWSKQDKTCKCSRKSSSSSYVQQKSRKTNDEFNLSCVGWMLETGGRKIFTFCPVSSN